tara:strand:- start:857 stop:1114 length:258 start_codon:yes stop_codon:yes gene_type:complete
MSTIKGNFGGPGGPQQPPQQQIDISATTAIKCEKCGNDTFEQSLLLRKLSALVSPTNQETIIPMAVFACTKCNHVNDDFREGELG